MPNTCIRFNDHDIIKQRAAKASRYLNLFTTMEEPSVFGTEGYRMANFCHNNGLYDFYGGENQKIHIILELFYLLCLSGLSSRILSVIKMRVYFQISCILV